MSTSGRIPWAARWLAAAGCVSWLVAGGVAWAAVRLQPGPQPLDMEKSRAWTGRFLGDAASLPISFLLDGKPVTGIPADWKPVSRCRRIDANLVETIFEGRQPQTGLGLRVECAEYLDYPVVEWVAWFSNAGGRPTPILSDILALDARFDGARPVLQHNNGDFCSERGYATEETPLDAGVRLRFAPSGGRACDQAFPYYRLAFSGCGLSLAVGWPGQWSADFRGLAGGVRIHAGQEQTHLRLLPGETIRTPRMTLMSWTGEASRAVNLWRRWYRDHVLPRPDGRRLGPLLAGHGTDPGKSSPPQRGKTRSNTSSVGSAAAFGRTCGGSMPVGIPATTSNGDENGPSPGLGSPTRSGSPRGSGQWPTRPRATGPACWCGSSPSGSGPAPGSTASIRSGS